MFSIIFGIIFGIAVLVGLFVIDYLNAQRYEEEVARAKRYGETDPKIKQLKKVMPVLWPVSLVPVAIMLVIASVTIVSAGHVGVQVTLGTVNQETLTEGLHFVNPISSVKEVEVRVVKADLKGAQAGTKDLQVVHTDIVVNYRIDGAKAANMYKEFGLDLENKILLPAINETFKAVTAHYNSEELITKRDEVSHTIHTDLQNKVGKYGLDISEISLVNFGFSAEYQAAIEQKVIATQSKLKAEQDLARIKVEADQRIAQADGEAKAIAIQAQAIQSNGGAQYVQLQAIEKWDGKLPNTMSGVVPFINVGK
jgi:regulator of protease activity HflC (stomatin/prohibitin superfamily)